MCNCKCHKSGYRKNPLLGNECPLCSCIDTHPDMIDSIDIDKNPLLKIDVENDVPVYKRGVLTDFY